MTLSPLDLLGTWTLDRTVDDKLADRISTVDGTTELTLDPDGRVRWSESGTFHHDGQDLPVSRTLFVEPRDDGWFVTFDDGRDFHPWSPEEQVVHPCGADTYTGLVHRESDNRWTVEWRVVGPAKDYVMRSALSR